MDLILLKCHTAHSMSANATESHAVCVPYLMNDGASWGAVIGAGEGLWLLQEGMWLAVSVALWFFKPFACQWRGTKVFSLHGHLWDTLYIFAGVTFYHWWECSGLKWLRESTSPHKTPTDQLQCWLRVAGARLHWLREQHYENRVMHPLQLP